MNKEISVSEKEFAVLREISNNQMPAQRTIAKKTGLSLGLTNLLIKRLIKKGYLKATQLNRKKIQYILTPKGFREKAKKSYNYTVKTIEELKRIKHTLQQFILQQYNSGKKDFYICGNGELSDLVEISINSLNNSDIVYKKFDENQLNLDEIEKVNRIVLLTVPFINMKISKDVIDVLNLIST